MSYMQNGNKIGFTSSNLTVFMLTYSVRIKRIHGLPQNFAYSRAGE